MGLLVSFFKRKDTTESVLENLSKQISSLQEARARNSELERRLAFGLVFYSSIIYIFAAIAWYYFGASLSQNQAWYSRLLYVLPFILSPLLLFMLCRLLRWFFVRRITKTEENLKRLEIEREEIFTQLMEKETYKRVVELMKKYFPEKLKDSVDGEPRLAGEGSEIMPNTSPSKNKAEVVRKRDTSPTGQSGVLRHRRTTALGGNNPSGSNVKTTTGSQNPAQELLQQPSQPQLPTSPMPNPQPVPILHQNAPLMRPILPQNRSTTDRVIDWLLGDGVENRYALICAACCSHNGMALREEFEFMAYRCAYCGYFNPAKKARTGAALAPPIPERTQGAVDVMTMRSPPSHHGSLTNLDTTDSSSKDNVAAPAAESQEAEGSQSGHE